MIRHTKIPEQLIKYICESWQADISYERAKDLFVQVILYLQKYDDDVSDDNIWNYGVSFILDTVVFHKRSG